MKVKACMAIIFFLLLGVNSVAQSRKKLTEAEVAQRFEQFVIDNGYTDLPPSKDKSKIVPEPVWGRTDDASVARRQDTLERKPLRIRRGGRIRNGWVAFFIPKHRTHQNVVQLIYMDAYGRKMFIEHQTIYLDEFEGKKPR
jgi:hypothetical protein